MSQQPESKLAGKLFLCMIGVSLLLIGGVFEWLMIRSYQHAKASRAWPQVKAVILRSEVIERQIPGSPKEYQLGVLYEYSYEGESFTSERITPRGTKWTKDTRTLTDKRELYTKGSVHQVWVNPDVEEFAILKHDTKAAGYSAWFPALIILGGAGMIFGALFRKK